MLQSHHFIFRWHYQEKHLPGERPGNVFTTNWKFQPKTKMIGDNQGDNGGPLTVVMVDRHILAGVVSLAWLGDCGGFEVVLLNIGSWRFSNVMVSIIQEGRYAVYSEVAHYRDWIDSTMKANGGEAICNIAITTTSGPEAGWRLSHFMDSSSQLD